MRISHSKAACLAAFLTASAIAALAIAPAARAETPAQTAAFCQVTWRFPDGLRTFSGAGVSEAEALAEATAKCRTQAPEGTVSACSGAPLISCGVTLRGKPQDEKPQDEKSRDRM